MDEEKKAFEHLPDIIDVDAIPLEEDLTDFEIKEPEETIETEKETYYEVTEKASVEEEQTDKKPEEDVDTSFNGFKEKQYHNERKWRKKTGSRFIKIILGLFGIIIGLPILCGFGFALVIGGGSLFLAAIGIMVMALVGLGVSAFMITAYTGTLGVFVLFLSIAGLGGSGLVLMLCFAIIIWIKNRCVSIYKKRQLRNEREAY